MLTRVTTDYKCDGCGAVKTQTRKKTKARTLFQIGGNPPGWSRDHMVGLVRRGSVSRDLCAACTKAVSAAKRAALAKRRKTRK